MKLRVAFLSFKPLRKHHVSHIFNAEIPPNSWKKKPFLVVDKKTTQLELNETHSFHKNKSRRLLKT
jgi:hypothetical protein